MARSIERARKRFRGEKEVVHLLDMDRVSRVGRRGRRKEGSEALGRQALSRHLVLLWLSQSKTRQDKTRV